MIVDARALEEWHRFALPTFLDRISSKPAPMPAHGSATGRGRVKRGARLYTCLMSSQREELHEIVESLDDDGVRAVLAAAEKRTKRPAPSAAGDTWPPGWFNVGTAGRRDIAANAEQLLKEGLGHPR